MTLSPLQVGKSVFIRTVTLYYTGRIVEITPEEIVLEDAAWIPEMGRFANALAKGDLKEVEPYPGLVSIMRAALVDVSEYNHKLPRLTK